MLKGFSVQQVLGASGVANSILFLNGSKVVTGSSALTFDGTKFVTSGNMLVGRSNGIGSRFEAEAAYQAGAPSVSTFGIATFNNGGAVSLRVGGTAYSYMWLQAIQDDGSNNLKNLVLQPLGGDVEVSNGLVVVDGSTNKSFKINFGVANGSVATTLGSVGPTGSTAGDPQGWMRLNVNGTDRYIPYW